MHSFMQHKTSVWYISWMSYVSQFGWKPACKAKAKWQIDMLIKSTSKMFPGFRDGQRRHRGNCKNMNTKKNEYKKCLDAWWCSIAIKIDKSYCPLASSKEILQMMDKCCILLLVFITFYMFYMSMWCVIYFLYYMFCWYLIIPHIWLYFGIWN